jgi:hypothetical protein
MLTECLTVAYLLALAVLVLAVVFLMRELSRPHKIHVVRRYIFRVAVGTSVLAVAVLLVAAFHTPHVRVSRGAIAVRAGLLCISSGVAWIVYWRSATSTAGAIRWALAFENILVVVFALTAASAGMAYQGSRNALE